MYVKYTYMAHVRDKRAYADSHVGTHNEMFSETFGGQDVALPTEPIRRLLQNKFQSDFASDSWPI